jgi:hypothetical protein
MVQKSEISTATLRWTHDIQTYWRDPAENNNAKYAYQGCWDDAGYYVDGKLASRVGVMYFPFGKVLRGKPIKSIKIKTFISGGYNVDITRTITIWSSQKQNIDTSVNGAAYLEHELGTLTVNEQDVKNGGTFDIKNNPFNQEFILDMDNNAELFSKWADRIFAGDNLFLLYNGEDTAMQNMSYSKNFLALTNVEIDVEYFDAPNNHPLSQVLI